MDYRGRNNLFGNMGSLLGGQGGAGGLLSTIGSLAGGGGAGGLLSLLGNIPGGGNSGGNANNILGTLSGLGGLGGNNGNAMAAISSLMANMNKPGAAPGFPPPGGFSPPPPPGFGHPNPGNYPPPQGFPPPYPGNYPPPQGFSPESNPLAGIDTNALMNRLSSLMSNLENAAANPNQGPSPSVSPPSPNPPIKPNLPNLHNQPATHGATSEDTPIIDADTGQPETPTQEKEANTQAEAPPISPESLNGILSLLSSVLGNQQGQNPPNAGAYAPGGNYSQNPYPPQGNYQQSPNAYPPQDNYQQSPNTYPPQGNYQQGPYSSGNYQQNPGKNPRQGWYGNRQNPGQFKQAPFNQGQYPPRDNSPSWANKGVMNCASLEAEPYSPCTGCDNPWCRHQEELPTFAQVREMAANWHRY